MSRAAANRVWLTLAPEDAADLFPLLEKTADGRYLAEKLRTAMERAERRRRVAPAGGEGLPLFDWAAPPAAPARRRRGIYDEQIQRIRERGRELPQSVQEIADVIGREQALRLVGKLPSFLRRDLRWPGAQSRELILYVPKSLRPEHRLVEAIGWDDAQRLVRAFGGEILRPASCAGIYRAYRDASALEMIDEGMVPRVVAHLVGVSLGGRGIQELVDKGFQRPARCAVPRDRG